MGRNKKKIKINYYSLNKAKDKKEKGKIKDEKNEEEINRHINAYKEKLFGKTNSKNSSINSLDASNSKRKRDKQNNGRNDERMALNLQSSSTSKDLGTRWFDM